jgi:hypothetical protein
LTHYFGAAKELGIQHLDFSTLPRRPHFAIAIVGPLGNGSNLRGHGAVAGLFRPVTFYWCVPKRPSLHKLFQAGGKFVFLENTGRKKRHRGLSNILRIVAACRQVIFPTDTIENLLQEFQVVWIGYSGGGLERVLHSFLPWFGAGVRSSLAADDALIRYRRWSNDRPFIEGVESI